MKQETEDKEYWDTLIDANKVKFSLSLSKIWKYKDLILMFVKRDITVTYKQTILGPVWFIIQPILTTLVFTIIFGGIMNGSSGGTSHVLFYMSGIVVWNLFSTSLIKTSNTFLANASLYEKVYFPRLTIPISVVISNFISFSIQFSVFLLLLAYYIFFKSLSIHISPLLLLMPVLLILTALLGMGLGIIVSSLSAKFRDLTFLTAFAVQLAMFLSPVILPLSAVSGTRKTLILANPMSSIIEAVRYIFLSSGELNLFDLAYTTLFTIIILITGLAFFNYKEKSFIDTV
ncbi:MAG TPA: ABC transporter permease [Bacteroidia bacterium]|jgi:lipopolysaccharide transport system permease protein|nr:ABC transporter permease [Bacteroidia bacterium]